MKILKGCRLFILLNLIWFCFSSPFNAKELQCHYFFNDEYNMDILDCCCQSADYLTKFPDLVRNVSGIDVSDNRLTSLEVGLFSGLVNIIHLDLSRNQITKLEVGIFDSLQNLILLDLATNRLESLPLGIFDQLINLDTLKLQINEFKTLGVRLFDSLVNLFYFGWGGVLISSLSDLLSDLNTRDLTENKLESLPLGIFDQLINLDTLHVRRNNIAHIEPGLFDSLTKLTSLQFGAAKIQRVDATMFHSLTSLQSVFLKENLYLTYIDSGVFANEPYQFLNRMDWSMNSLVALCTGIFDNLIDLRILYLSQNQLVYLEDGLFDGLRHMEHLFLNGNNLTSIGKGLFDSFYGLTNLLLHDNRLTYLPQDIFESMGNLEQLTLHGNPITSIEPEHFESLKNSQLSMPVVCSCSIGKRLISLLMKNVIRFTIRHGDSYVSIEWIGEIENCKVTRITSYDCSRTEGTTVSGITSEYTQHISELCPSKDVFTSIMDVTKEMTTEDTTFFGTSERVSLPRTADIGPSKEGIVYTVMAVTFAIVASFISLYFVSTKAGNLLDMLKNEIPNIQYDDAIADMFLEIDKFKDKDVTSISGNIPPLSFLDVLYPLKNLRIN